MVDHDVPVGGASGSYRPGIGEELLAEVNRLDAQAALSWPEEWRVLSELGIDGQGPVLEIGCGPGAVTRRLRTLLQDRPLIGLDADGRLIGVARASLGQEEATFLIGRAEAIPLATGSVGTALARLVFQHLPDPIVAAREAARVLVPRGRFLVIDVDQTLWGASDPSLPGLADVYRRAGGYQARQHGDPLVARRLWRILQAAGFTDLALRPFAYHSGALGLDAFAAQMSPERLLPLVSSGVIGVADYAAAAEAYRRFRGNETAFVLMLGFVAAGSRP